MNYDIFRLSSLRLAPVQVVSYGHSSSTHGAEVDFFIG
jgi:predicted O-linked N-acetylglucosamine transferase (SPINDLY family)